MDRSYTKTKRGVLLRAIRNQLIRCKRKNWSEPGYTRQDWLETNLNDPLFCVIYDKWVESGYQKGLKPSVDRIDNKKLYTWDNVQWMTWDENNRKGNREWSRDIRQLTVYGEHVQRFCSVAAASRKLKVCYTGIYLVCAGKRNTSKGFKWEFVQ